jgi:hypothetical protein
VLWGHDQVHLSFRLGIAKIRLDISGLILFPIIIILLPCHLLKVCWSGYRDKILLPFVEFLQSLLRQLSLLVHAVNFDTMTTACHMQTPVPGAPDFIWLGI